MSSHGIKDRVAIVGMGCTRFAEHWDKGLDDLIVEAAEDTFASAGITKEDVDAYWFGTAQSGMSGITLARPLQLQGKPITRVENYCTTGSEALRAAAYAVASGAYDVAMAVGAEKVKDSGYQGLNAFPIPNDGTQRTLTAAAMFSMVAPAYGKKYGVDAGRAHRGAGPHLVEEPPERGAQPEGASSGRRSPRRPSVRRPGWPGASGCSTAPVSPTGPPPPSWSAPRMPTGTPTSRIFIKALSFSAGSGSGLIDPEYDYTWFPECAGAAEDAYQQAGITDPRHQLAMAEVHDCFTPTELVLMEDLGFAERGTAWKEVLAGTFDRTGELPVNPDGGLKSFGHPVGASGLRMFFEAWLQLRGEATPERQIDTDRKLALTHNLGGYPGEMVVVRVGGGNRARLIRRQPDPPRSELDPLRPRGTERPGPTSAPGRALSRRRARVPAALSRRGTPTTHRQPAGPTRPRRWGRHPARATPRGPTRRVLRPWRRGRPRTRCRRYPCRTGAAGPRPWCEAMAAAWVS